MRIRRVRGAADTGTFAAVKTRCSEFAGEPGARPLVILAALANSISSFAAEEIFMSRSCRGLIRSLLALALVAAIVPAAQAYQTPKRHHHVVAHVAADR